MGFLNFKKIVLIVILLTFLSSFFQPVLTKAAVPVFETNPTVVGILPNDIFEFTFNILVQSLKKKLLDMIVDQITTWIQGGARPKFITNWSGFLKDAADQAAGDYIRTWTGGMFCSALNEQIIFNALPVPKFSGPGNACTLSLQGENLANFFRNFENGGWTSWIKMTSQPQNNVFGQYSIAHRQFMEQRTAAQQAALYEAQASRGFLGVRKCVQEDPETGTCLREAIVTPGAVVGDLAARALASDIDFIVNSDDLAAYVSAIVNAALNRLLSEGLNLMRTSFAPAPPGPAPVAGLGAAERACAALLGRPAFGECVRAVESGRTLFQFQVEFFAQEVQRVIGKKQQTLAAKQNTLLTLNQTVDVLTQLRICLIGRGLPFEETLMERARNAQVSIQNNINAINAELIDLGSLALNIRNAETLAQLNLLIRGAALNPEVENQRLIEAQNETTQKQSELSLYQSQLDNCLGAGGAGGGA